MYYNVIHITYYNVNVKLVNEIRLIDFFIVGNNAKMFSRIDCRHDVNLCAENSTNVIYSIL